MSFEHGTELAFKMEREAKDGPATAEEEQILLVVERAIREHSWPLHRGFTVKVKAL